MVSENQLGWRFIARALDRPPDGVRCRRLVESTRVAAFSGGLPPQLGLVMSLSCRRRATPIEQLGTASAITRSEVRWGAAPKERLSEIDAPNIVAVVVTRNKRRSRLDELPPQFTSNRLGVSWRQTSSIQNHLLSSESLTMRRAHILAVSFAEGYTC
jgi:hypothetical protein